MINAGGHEQAKGVKEDEDVPSEPVYGLDAAGSSMTAVSMWGQDHATTECKGKNIWMDHSKTGSIVESASAIRDYR